MENGTGGKVPIALQVAHQVSCDHQLKEAEMIPKLG